MEYIRKCIRDTISQTATDSAIVTIANTCGISTGVLHLTLTRSKVQGQVYFGSEYLANGCRYIGNIAIANKLTVARALSNGAFTFDLGPF